MRIWLIAAADSIWTKKYIENILLPQNMDVTVLSWHNSPFEAFYAENSIPVILMGDSPAAGPTAKPQATPANIFSAASLRRTLWHILKKLTPEPMKKTFREVRFYRKLRKATGRLSAPDMVHIHYVPRGTDSLFYRFILFLGSPLILTYWGSDLFRAEPRQYNKKLIRVASQITFMTTGLQDRFREVYGTEYDGKLRVIDFGVSAYDTIDACSDAATPTPGLPAHPSGKICIAVGYNAFPAQQHGYILEALARLPRHILRKCHIVLQYSYGRTKDAEYYHSIEQQLATMGCTWTIIDKFLDDAETAILRKNVDIFIHAQTTDALSASMLEYLYAGAIVINGAWLNYDILEKAGIFYFTFENFQELTQLMETIINNRQEYAARFSKNRKALYALNSWNAVRNDWYALYATPGEKGAHA